MLLGRRNKPKTNRLVKLADSPAVPSGQALRREVAGVASDIYEPLCAYLGVRPNRDPLLASRKPDSAYAYPYGLFEEALDKDAHLSAMVTQRKAAVLSWERSVVPADASGQAQAVAAFVEQALAGIGVGGLRDEAVTGGGFERDLTELLDAIPFGLAVSEVIWDRADTPGQGANGAAASGNGAGGMAQDGQLSPPPGGWLMPTALKSRHPRRFVFGAAGELKLLSAAEPFLGAEMPPYKFLVFAPYGRHEDPYGLPALRSVWWLTYFKRQALRFWVMYAEKFGTPTTVLKHPPSATEKEKAAYRRIVGSIQQETGLVVPEGVELMLLEAQRGGSVDAYRELTELCNAEMSKALLGQTLTADAGDRGARSLGEVHLKVRQDIVRQDAQALMQLINGQLVRWVVDLNLAPELRLYPRWQLKPPAEPDIAQEIEVDKLFASLGLPLDEAEMYARYGRARPAGREAQ